MNANTSEHYLLDQPNLRVVEVKGKKLLKEFIHLPSKVHAKNSNWLPPIYVDEWKFFNPLKNKSFSHCNTILLLAYIDSIPVGRIMGIINNTYNGIKGETTARFGYLECYNNQHISSLLIGAIENWARGFGMNRIIGPYGFSDKDPQGLLIEGFEHMPIIDSPCNMPYLVNLVEENGYKKEFDCFGFINNLSNSLPNNYESIANRIFNNNAYRFVSPTKRSELKPLILPILRLVNETYSHLYGFIPMEELEMMELANRYMPIIDPRFVKVAMIGDRIVGFILGLPNFTPGLQKAKGKLFPFGIVHILSAMKRTKQLDLMLGAVDNAYRGRGIEIVLAQKLIESCKKAKLNTIEVHLVLESNTPMLSELKRAGYLPHKRFRVFGKDL
jgi:ribosomal protein S18 acetylase RimI-like enzyme